MQMLSNSCFLLSTLRPIFQSKPVLTVLWTWKAMSKVNSVPVSLDLCRESRELCGTYRALSDAAVLLLLTQEESEIFHSWGYWGEFRMPLTLFSEEISRTSNQHLSPALKRTVIKMQLNTSHWRLIWWFMADTRCKGTCESCCCLFQVTSVSAKDLSGLLCSLWYSASSENFHSYKNNQNYLNGFHQVCFFSGNLTKWRKKAISWKNIVTMCSCKSTVQLPSFGVCFPCATRATPAPS